MICRIRGRAMLYHRHITAGLVRDWSRAMEVFSGTVDASAQTWKFHNEAMRNMAGPAFSKFIKTEYLRPRPAPSDYLDTAVTPAPWPTRTGSKKNAGRLALGKEPTPKGLPIPR